MDVESYQCSITKITATTEWEAPNAEVPEKVTATVFDGDTSKPAKTIYLISSPKGTEVTLKTERKDGNCTRDGHKKRIMLWNDFKKDEKNNSQSQASVLSFKIQSPLDPYVFKLEPQKKVEDLKAEEKLKIKCFEVGGVYQALMYFSLPVPIDKNYVTTFKYNSCAEGPIQYRIVSYPDISFKGVFSIGSDAVKNKNNTSKFEKNTSKPGRITTQLKDINENSLDVNVEFKPSLTLSTKYNGGKDELELKFNFDKDKDFCSFKYKHDSREENYSSSLFNIPGTIKKIENLCSLISKISKVDFLKALMDFDATSLVSNYKPYKLKLGSPSVSFSIESKYHTTKDLSEIGKLIDVCFACDPLLSISLTVDLLFLIISAATAGSGTGFYVMLKNLDKVIGKILGDDYRKKYKKTKPFSADVYFNFIVTGSVSGDVHCFIDTTEKRNANSDTKSIQGKLKVDLEAGAKVSLDTLFIAVEGEASASASTGIKIKFGIEDHMLQGRGMTYLVEGIFLGIKIKYCIKGKVGWAKTKSYGKSLVDGKATLMDASKLFSGQFTIFENQT